MLRKIFITLVFGIGVLLVSETFPAVTQGAREERGQKLYMHYCASCHGTDGKGGGPVASSLKTAIPDLTTIEKRNGKFDQLRMQHIIAGEVEVAAHGQKEMPVWGYVFRQKAGGQSAATLNVYTLAAYLKSIQAK